LFVGAITGDFKYLDNWYAAPFPKTPVWHDISRTGVPTAKPAAACRANAKII
jgi:hypothetical protein